MTSQVRSTLLTLLTGRLLFRTKTFLLVKIESQNFAQICFAHEIVQKKSEAEHFGKIAKMFCALFTKKVQDFLSFYTTWDTYI